MKFFSSKILKEIITDFEAIIDSDNKAYHGFSRVRAELIRDDRKFIDYLQKSTIQDYKLSKHIGYRWICQDGKHWHPPQDFALHVENYTFRIERWSNLYTLMALIMSSATALFSTDFKENIVLVLMCGGFSIWFALSKWNIDNKIYQAKVIANHLRSLRPR